MKAYMCVSDVLLAQCNVRQIVLQYTTTHLKMQETAD